MSWPEAFFYSVCVVVGASLMLKAGSGAAAVWLARQKTRVHAKALRDLTDGLIAASEEEER